LNHPRHLALSALLALGCATAAPVARPAPPPAPAPIAAVPAPVAAPPPALRFEGATVAFEAPWALPDVPALRFALVTGVPGYEPRATAVGWEDAPGHTQVSPMMVLADTVRVQRVSIVDATGDGEPDAVVWIDPASLPPEQVPHNTAVFTWSHAQRSPRPAPWTALALGVVADEAALRAAAPTLRSFLAPGGDASLDAVMLRLGFATAAQFRSIVAPAGVVVCDSAEGNARPHYHRCRTYAPAAITDAVYAERFRGTIAVFGAPGDPDEQPLVESYERCRSLGNRVACSVPTGGPAVTVVTFAGPSEARRLTRVETTVYEDS
jgi:hypothetical protein